MRGLGFPQFSNAISSASITLPAFDPSSGAIVTTLRENRWGAPRIFSELLMLGFKDVSEASVSRYLRKYRSLHPDKKKQQSWMTFLKNHRDVISAMDFFIVPTINFNILFVFFIIDHKRRKIRHFNVTSQPSALWVIQQLRDAFPFDQISKYLIMDRDIIFSTQVKGFLEQQLGIKPKITSYKSPWQKKLVSYYTSFKRFDMSLMEISLLPV